ncbi:APC family permease [Angustibacter luteus]|uniref:APC family permease n=1 Tax=Angustibacter luteus TaxID=658456 RepID=A0ABW1JEB2_9ACTN
MAQEDHGDYQRLGGSGRKLTIIDAVAQSIGFMGPVFSIAFLVPLLVGIISATGKGGGNAAPLSVLIAAVGVLALGWIVAQYTRKIQAAGSLYDYVTDGLGGRLGVASGLLYYCGILVLSTGLLVLIGGTIHDTLLAEFGHSYLPETVWDLLLLAILAGVLYLGVALSTRAQLTLALVSITVVLIFFIYVIIKVGSDNSVATAFKPSSSPQGWNGILFGVLYGVLLFTGFETSANLAEETEHPKRDIPRAVLFSVMAVAGFYVIGSYATVAGYHFDLEALGKNAGAPLFGLAGPAAEGGYGSVALRRLMELVVVLDMLAVLIGTAVAASRGFFAMGRDRRLPSVLGKVSGRGTPLVASTFVLAFGLLVILVTKFWTALFALPETPHYASIFYWASTFGGFALATIYFLMSIGALRGLSDTPKRALLYLAAVVGIVITLAAMFGSVYKVTAPTIYAPYAALGVFVVGLALTWVMPGRAPASTQFGELTESEQGPVRL